MACNLTAEESIRMVGAGLSVLAYLSETDEKQHQHYVKLVSGVTNLTEGYEILFNEASRIGDTDVLERLKNYKIGDDIFTRGYTSLNKPEKDHQPA